VALRCFEIRVIQMHVSDIRPSQTTLIMLTLLSLCLAINYITNDILDE